MGAVIFAEVDSPREIVRGVIGFRYLVLKLRMQNSCHDTSGPLTEVRICASKFQMNDYL
jgi:hypothetical protein